MRDIISQLKGVLANNKALTLDQWRERSFVLIFASTVVVSLPALIASSLRSLKDGLLWNGVIYVAAYSFNFFLLIFKSLPFRVRAWTGVVVFTSLGVVSVYSLGPLGSGRVWFFTASILATLTLGARSALLLILFQICALCVFGYLFDVGLVTPIVPLNFSFGVWVASTITFSFLSIISMAAMGSLIRGIGFALNQAQDTSKELRESTRQLQKRVEAHNESLESLRESEQRWRFALEGSGDGVLDWDIPQDRLTFSPAFLRMLGYASEELEGGIEHGLEIIYPEDRERIRSAVEELRGGTRVSYQDRYRIMCKNGEYKWLFGRAKVIAKDESGAPVRVIGVHTDISPLKEMEQEKIQLQDRLNQAQKMEALGTLAGGIAHDFNNILSAIVGYADLAAAELPADEEGQIYIQQVVDASYRAAQLVQQILMFSRKSSLEKKPVHLHYIVKEAVQMMRSSLPSTIEIHEDYKKDRRVVFADPTAIHQVVVNLCTNALHAMKDQKGLLRIALDDVHVDVEQMVGEWSVDRGNYSVLTIEDNGSGMSKETMNQIFEPYFTTKAKGEGTGLGLATVHGIVKNCDGFITVESSPGNGTTFNIHFPTQHQGSGEIGKSQVSPPGWEHIQRTASGHERILLVDDESNLCNVGKELLEKLGYQVIAISSSREAMDAFARDPEQFDLVVSDQTMPDFTGVDLFAAMSRVRPGLPFILYTGFTSTITKEEALSMGIKAFLEKPLTATELAKQVRAVLDSRLTM
ncbi:MAG: hypothetical protein CSA62_14420 [Planctomycetota bacterium]|nr:MAG: hypothetical protein CSA62_14420 [Planctomycetota bacterium]